MTTLVVVLRIASLLAFAGPMLLAAAGRVGRARKRSPGRRGQRMPLVANLAALGLFLPFLLLFSGSAAGSIALLSAISGVLLAVSGVALVVRSRAELGAAWSFLPRAGRGMALVTTGPYRLVRHPIYLGLSLLLAGQALAFGSWPALLVVLCGVLPTFAWRARAEEKLLSDTFGDRYAAYCRRTRLIVPHLI